MVTLLKRGAEGLSIPKNLVIWSAQDLYRYRQPFDSRLLLEAYGEFKSPELKRLMVLKRMPEAKNLVADALGHGMYLEDNAISAGILRLSDDATVAKLRLMLGYPRPFQRLAAQWALAQINGSEADLQPLIELVLELEGIRPKTPAFDWDMARDAFRLLSVTRSPQVADAMKLICSRDAKPGDNSFFEGALASLYYVQKDYTYVDRKVLELMRGARGKPTFGIMWKIAAERRTPPMELLAVELNAEAYKWDFILEQGRPPEYWIYQYLSDIPEDVLPPVRQ
jgi:hypothetical protein